MADGTHTARACVFASPRLSARFVFLRAFFDKTFDFGQAAQADKGWIDGGPPDGWAC
ncbi:hypothetical protein [Streptomyces europaeiscabiei]|uniref:hypothetical protein n=1 Tax=Streptomyces europaeiscabiei TaxID=146819 RepID=UPI002E136541|nr:hypothetical protein OHB30_02090 [Streptomyces europaeiscabiei]